MHPWHNIELGKKFPEVLSAIIEIPKDSIANYRFDTNSGLINHKAARISAHGGLRADSEKRQRLCSAIQLGNEIQSKQNRQ